jgi:hypothetical protein
MAQSVYLREQTERCRRLELANEYVASAAAAEGAETNSKRRPGRSRRRSDWLAAIVAGGVINRRK